MVASLGQRLREAREAKKLKMSDIADQLRFSNTKIIEAIESDRYPQQPIDVYWHGYVMSYARLLDMPLPEVEEALEALGYQKNRSVVVPPKPKLSEAPWIQRLKKYWIKGASVFVIVILIGLVVIWHYLHREIDLIPANSSNTDSLSITSNVSAQSNEDNTHKIPGTNNETTNQNETADKNVAPDQSLMVIKNHYALPNAVQDQEDQNS